MPTVSLLMSVYRGERADFFMQALESLREQTRPADEVVLVEDGPLGEELHQLIETYRTLLPIRSVVLEQNQGLAAALNAGLKVAKGDLVARMDTDDICLPERLEMQVAFMANSDADIVGGFATEIDENNVQGRLRAMPVTHAAIVQGLWANPLIHPTVIFRRKKILALGGYDEKNLRAQDYELWFRCAAAGLKFANIDRPVIHYRFIADSLRRSSRSAKFDRGLMGYRLSRQLGLPLWKQMACFAPFFRSVLPSTAEKSVYRMMQRFRP